MKSYIASMMIAGSLFASAMFGQTQPATPPTPVKKVAPKTPPPTVNARRENQQDRIAQGVKSGQLTAKETSRLENKEARINREVHADRVATGGNLTNKQKAQINRQQNNVSKQIYDDKHNTAVQPK